MAVDPRTLRVLRVSCLHQPEGNEVMDGILTRLLLKYLLLDGVVMDGACAFLLFHGATDCDQCPCNPHHMSVALPFALLM